MERSVRCSFPIPSLPYLFPSLFSDDGSPFFELLNIKQDQLDQLVSISVVFCRTNLRSVSFHKGLEGRHCIFFDHVHQQNEPE